MRIACVHIPQFALQCATRIDPSLRSERHAPVVIVGPASLASHAAEGGGRSALLHSPIVLACSRAAWALGARVGMTATTARSLSPAIEVVTADALLERDTVRSIADVLLAITPVVDLGGRVGPGGAHLAMYCEVPAKTRGTTFGERLLARLAGLGLTARIGIADDRFTAWVAASSPPTSQRHDDRDVVSVPRGGSAAFLAPRPLALLSIPPEVQHMLEALGVRTLGEFAALPAPTVSSRAARFEADYQALARGESGTQLRPYAPDAPIREEAVIHAHDPGAPTDAAATASTRHAGLPGDPSSSGLSIPAAVALLAERIAMRLAGRARCAARLDITIAGDGGERLVTISPVRDGGTVLASAEELAEAIGAAVGDSTSAQAWRLRVVVAGEALAGDGADVDVAPTTPTQRAFTIASAVAPGSAAAGSAGSAALAASCAAALAGSSSAAPAGPSFAARSASSAAAPTTSASAEATESTAGEIDTLTVVLSTTGGTLDRVFGLTSPVANALASERRDAHRRTRRGKQRRRVQVTTTVQPRLFKM